MKKLLVAILLIVSAPFIIQAQDLTEILENHYETMGQKKMAKINSITISGTMFMMNAEFPFTRFSKRSNKYRLEAEVMGQKLIQCVNGDDGWMVAPWTGSIEPQDIPADQLKQLKREADIDGPLYNYEEKGITLEYEGIEDLEGSDVYRIKVTYDDGDIITQFIDVESYVLLKTVATVSMMGASQETETYLSNYKMIDGIAVPFSIETRANGQVTGQININEIKYDLEIEDSLFERPVKKE